MENGNGYCWRIKLNENVPTPYLWFDSAFGTIRGEAAIARGLNKAAAIGFRGAVPEKPGIQYSVPSEEIGKRKLPRQ
ncbi:MAG: hypothetical protein DM484_30335 [Candidatus Methylumidiphilus alinenensis]|uniref:Uncharacterized protein n=1 Tax=Candidatus Methylumidiphilus alinenensis TaxID=2202197 RepID=A0A2W4SB79_9GAMM|nr:MAG: hypothetical protein DM484_30335 [Candidatus Methylumidiphilus alinenensis]